MRIVNFAKRNFKEIIRDPISIVFAVLLPMFLLFIFQQFKIPNEVYKIENFTPGIIIFGFSFITMFTSALVSQDRTTSLLTRLCASPMRPYEYIIGYILSILPIILIQEVLFFITALLLGLEFNINIILTIFVSLIVSILYIFLGIIIGCISSYKGSTGISSVVVQLVIFTSGMYFSLDMIGKVFSTICNILPFKASLDIVKEILNNKEISSYSIIVFIIYLIILVFLGIKLFNKVLKSDNK